MIEQKQWRTAKTGAEFEPSMVFSVDGVVVENQSGRWRYRVQIAQQDVGKVVFGNDHI